MLDRYFSVSLSWSIKYTVTAPFIEFWSKHVLQGELRKRKAPIPELQAITEDDRFTSQQSVGKSWSVR